MSKEMMDTEEKGKPEEERPEERESAPVSPSAPVMSGVLFGRLSRAWVVATAFFFAAFIYYLAPTDSFLFQKPLFEIPLGGPRALPIRPMFFVAAIVFGAGVSLLFKYGRSGFDYQKPGQGRWARLCAYAGAGVLALFAGVALHGQLYAALPLSSAWQHVLWSTEIAGIGMMFRPIFYPGAAVTCGLLLAFHLYFNRPKWADFLIETQSEMRKVSWPPRHEWVGSTLVVLIVTACVSLFLYVVDLGLSRLLRELRIGF